MDLQSKWVQWRASKMSEKMHVEHMVVKFQYPEDKKKTTKMSRKQGQVKRNNNIAIQLLYN